MPGVRTPVGIALLQERVAALDRLVGAVREPRRLAGEDLLADRAYEMGAVNRVVPHAELEREAIAMARTVLTKSPTAIRMLKFAFNAVDDGMVGQQVFAGEATRLAYGTDEAVEGRDAFLEKRDPDWGPYPWHY